MLPIMLISVFITVLSAVYGIYLIFFEHRHSVKERLSQTRQADVTDSNEEVEAEKGNKLSGLLNKFNKDTEKSKYFLNVQSKLLQAYIKMKPLEFVKISLGAGLVTGTLLYLFSGNLLFLFIGFPLGYKVPDMILEIVRKKRVRKLNSQLPQSLGLLANGLRAGYSFSQAMAVITKEMEAPIADEFGKVLRENAYGKPMEEALLDFSKRTDDEDLDMFITTLLIQMNVGGDLAEILDTISETIRERVKLRGEIRTLTAQNRMSAWVVGIMPFAIALLIYKASPDQAVAFITNPIGMMMAIAAAVLMVIGVFALIKIVNIKI
ncbi:type II secretion system F family protein [Trichococcus sp. K1Tr]|uniref:type II secretion system F family protein n=1 Tax=Trichococcus sp. K1Tr TaxID=3020847 RepID=UPI00232D1B8E|nr:type II secretion system F family protein [Trichococcus sp. K1Tr]MDB6353950.1 type II secretion system F family protein [Trichococcus sp. K1Tr]